MTVLPRSPSPAPPKGARKRIPTKIERDAALIALGLDPRNVDFHHTPPLALRPWNGTDFDPPQLDPKHIVPMPRDAHQERTAKIDTPAAAKTKRQAEGQAEARRRMLAKTHPEAAAPEKRKRWPKQKLRGRPFRPSQERRS